MKPNLEISLKFWTILIIAFAVVLSIPFCDYLYNNHLVQHIYITGLLLACLFFLAFNIDLVLRLKELKQKLSKETFFKDISMQTIEDYETQIKDQEDHIKELKKSFEDAVVEITELRSKNKQLQAEDAGYADRMCELKEELRIANKSITYWKERALHQKHTKKEVEDNVYLCIKSIGEYFIEGKKYKRRGNNKDLLHLVGESGLVHIVNKLHFKPAK